MTNPLTAAVREEQHEADAVITEQYGRAALPLALDATLPEVHRLRVDGAINAATNIASRIRAGRT